jgi:hypothetical protein
MMLDWRAAALGLALSFVSVGSQAAAVAPCPPALKKVLEEFPKPLWPQNAENLDAEVSFRRSAEAVAALGKILEGYREPLWWNSEIRSLQGCLQKNPDPNSEENLTPALQIEGNSQVRLVIVQAPLVGMYYQYFPLLLLRGSERNFVLPLERRATRCEAPGTVWLEMSKGPRSRLAVGANSCGLNPYCEFEAFRVDGARIVAEKLFPAESGSQSRATIPAWSKPGEIGCPNLIRGSEWARSLKFYRPNSQCQAESRKCPEYVPGELRLQAPKESR